MTETTTPTKLTTTAAVLEACQAHPEIAPHARLVGRWVWVEFEGKPSLELRAWLKAIGFRWNQDRLAWQHSCGHFTRRNTRIDPRMYYGEIPVTMATREEALAL